MTATDAYKAFAYTIRPKEGVKTSGKIEQKLIKYIKKYHGFIVAEKEGICRHLHGVIYYPNPKRKYDVSLVLKSFQESELGRELDYNEERVLKGGLKIAYNDDFFTEYTNKEESTLILENLPDNTTEYYPSEEEQAKVKRAANAVDKTYNHLLELWNESKRELSENSVKIFMYEMMYVQKKIKVIEDKKKFNQRCISLFHYINGEINDAAMNFLF
jgi:hypothetical protein